MPKSSRHVLIEKITSDEFAPFGQLIETQGAHSFQINNGLCTRFHDLAKIEFTGPAARPTISLVRGKPYQLPLSLPMVERHPLGSQAFYPLSKTPFLVVVCEDENGVPGRPRAFICDDQRGINFGRNVWHGILTPLERESDLLVIDRVGEGNNLEEFFFDEPYLISNV